MSIGISMELTDIHEHDRIFGDMIILISNILRHNVGKTDGENGPETENLLDRQRNDSVGRRRDV